MRPLALLLLVAACSDPGPRDRSLLVQVEGDLVMAPPGARRLPPAGEDPNKRASTSVIGLVPDPLAGFYAEDADLVVRISDFASLQREALPRIEELRKLLPDLGLPTGEPADLLRDGLGLPGTVAFDPVRPFAFVRVRDRWAAIVPTRDREEGGDRLKACDGIYCVAGDPAVVAAYEPGFRKGFYLPGDVSVVARPDALASLGEALAALLVERGIPAGPLAGLPALPPDIERVDLALRFGRGGLRIDVRLAPDRESPTGVYLERMRPRRPAAVRLLPPDGTAYFELSSAPLEWEGLLLNLLGPTGAQAPTAELRAAQRLLAAFGQDAAAVLKLDGSGNGTFYFLADLVDDAAARTFFESSDLTTLLKSIAGPEGHLEWKPDVLRRHGIEAGSVTGHLSRSRLEEWRQSGPVKATLGVLLRGPAVAYVAISDDRLCIVVGERARAEMERFLDRLRAGASANPDPLGEGCALFTERLASMSVNLASLFDGSREAAPYWHPKGRALQDLSLRWTLPASVAVTSEGGALRAALQVDPNLLADAALKIRLALNAAADSK